MKKWLQNNFLPMWAKETLLRDKRQLERENSGYSRRSGNWKPIFREYKQVYG